MKQKQNNKIKSNIYEKIFDYSNMAFMIIFCLITIYPYLNQLALSLNTGIDAAFGGITFYPRAFTWANYTAIFSSKGIQMALVVSGLRVIIGTFVAVTITTAAAYALSKKNIPGRKYMVWFLIMPMFINAGMIPTFFLFRYLNLIDNFWVYVLPGAFSFYNMVIIRTFMQGIPPSLEESAVLDGANDIQVLWHIILPLSKPVLATVCLWVAVFHWNDWMANLLYVTDQDLNTMQYMLLKVVKESEITQKLSESMVTSGGLAKSAKPTPETVKAATIMLTTLPIVMLYPFLQKYFVKGVTVGALKD